MSKPQVTKTAAQLFVECLENEGVEFIFGLPGEENAEFAMALQASSIKFILVRHESGAAFMADTYGRLTGRPGVCFATLGPGATNLLTGVANGNMDRAPLVAITGQGELGRLHRESHQVIDVVALFKPLVKWGVSIFKASVVPEVVYKAFKVALTEKPGAVHIELPEDVASFEAGDLTPIKHLDKVRRSVPDDKAIDQIWDMLKDAKKPVILAGNGVLRHHATGQLTEFVDATKIPVVNTFMAKGAIARSHPAALFTVGLSSGDFNNQVLEGSDLVLAIGYDVVEYHPKLWNPDSDLRIAHIDFAPAEVDTHYRTAAEAVGDLSHSLWMLNERVKEEPIEVDPSYYADIRQTMLDDFAFHAADDQQGSIKPQKMLWDLRETLGPKDIAISDVGAHKMWFSRYYQADEPLTAIVHNGFCSMGGALPGAIAAKLAFPDRTVVALAGDGAFLQNVQEMETARRIGTNIIVVVWVDGGYGLISWKQDNRWNKHSDLSFGNPDFDALAQAFDWAHFACDDSTKLAGVLQDAVAATAERPVLVSIPIDYAENPKLTERLGSLRCRE